MGNTGILILGMGHPMYGNMAYNLAVTLKASDPKVQIAVGHTPGSMRDVQRMQGDTSRIIDHLIEVPEDAYLSNGQQAYLKAKLHVLEISPFQNTLLLDADMAWYWRNGKTPGELLKSLQKVDFTVQNAGHISITGRRRTDEMVWAEPKEVAATFELKAKKMYRIFTECLWIKNTPENHELMALARQIFDDPKVKHPQFAGGVPDELALGIAMAILDRKPHKAEYYPIYWRAEQRSKGVPLNEHTGMHFYGLSIGGKKVSRPVEELYNHIVRSAYQEYGLVNAFPYVAKNRILPNRKVM